MRAVVQGLDERESWDRYLRSEGEHVDLRQVRSTVAWLRDEFAAAARREKRPGTARLVLLDTRNAKKQVNLPTLSEFAAQRGLEDFSEEEQLEAYRQAYPPEPGRGGEGNRPLTPDRAAARRRVLIGRQLEALRWLQETVTQNPRPADSVMNWLNPSTAARLAEAGVVTMEALVGRMNAVGARWWVGVRGVGPLKAARIQAWLQSNEAALGLRVGGHVQTPRRQLSSAVLAKAFPSGTAIVPFEKLIVPEEIDGREGRFRAARPSCRLNADNDHAAIGAWLASMSNPGGANLSSTQRAYRKEAERLLLWSVLERRKALSSLDQGDANRFKDFLQAPPPSWCGPRHQQRWSPLWRPLEGPLSPAALRQSLVTLRVLFGFLVKNSYVTVNPFAATALPRSPQRAAALAKT